jgi:hypothetical protein
VLQDDQSLSLTEFYFSSKYLQNIVGKEVEGQDLLSLPVEIVNHQGHEVAYRIEVWADGVKKIDELEGILVSPGDTRQLMASTGLDSSADVEFVEFRLFSEADTTPLAELRLWFEPSDDLNKSD